MYIVHRTLCARTTHAHTHIPVYIIRTDTRGAQQKPLCEKKDRRLAREWCDWREGVFFWIFCTCVSPCRACPEAAFSSTHAHETTRRACPQPNTEHEEQQQQQQPSSTILCRVAERRIANRVQVGTIGRREEATRRGAWLAVLPPQEHPLTRVIRTIRLFSSTACKMPAMREQISL